MLNRHRFLAEFRPILDNLPKMDMSVPVELVRQVPVPSRLSNPPKVEFWDEHFTTDDGASLRMRFYKPLKNQDKPMGLLYWTHGGGMCIGTPEMDDGLFERFAVEANVLVASVEYRLAPEHPYPTPLNDCYAGLVWLADNAERLSFDKRLIAIGGASAGGNLAVATSLMARDKKGPELFFQLPLCPMLDFRLETPSSYEITEEAVPFSWNRESNQLSWDRYLGDMDRNNVPYYASPALAPDLAGLPKTYMNVGQLDVFRDEIITFTQRLCQAKVDVELRLHPGVFHGFEMYGLPTCVRAEADYVRAMAAAFTDRRNEI